MPIKKQSRRPRLHNGPPFNPHRRPGIRLAKRLNLLVDIAAELNVPLDSEEAKVVYLERANFKDKPTRAYRVSIKLAKRRGMLPNVDN